ncbi:hypothetical protein P7C70_g8316, partial [Phenoliferia sp. Uapishka_3]
MGSKRGKYAPRSSSVRFIRNLRLLITSCRPQQNSSNTSHSIPQIQLDHVEDKVGQSDKLPFKSGTSLSRSSPRTYSPALTQSHSSLNRAQTIFSTELDLLLIRLHELSPHINKFFILESTHTFTGVAKTPILQSALREDSRFEPFLERINLTIWEGRELEKGEDPFTQENQVRRALTDILVDSLSSLPSKTPSPLMLFTDIDEIPSRSTVELLKSCDFGPKIHLGMKEFVYSFGWRVGGEGVGSWRGSAVVWEERGRGEGEYYRHGKTGERVLEGSGWHCS